MGPNIRFLAELIHYVYGFPLEPIEDSAVRSSKGLDSLSNCDIEKKAKHKVKQQEVKATPGRVKTNMDKSGVTTRWSKVLCARERRV